MSPIRVLSSGKNTNSTPHESSVEIGDLSSLSTQNIDLSFGPQSVPFVFLRRKEEPNMAESNDSPTKGSILPPRESKRILIIPVPYSAHPHPSARSAFQKSNHILEEGEIHEHGDSDVEYEVIGPKELGLSNWRKEQLRFMKPPALLKGTTLKALPTFHGPLSLPYARNPR